MTTITFEELKNKYQNKLEKETEVNCKLLAKIKDGHLVEINDEWEGFIHNNHMLNEAGGDLTAESFSALIISGPDKGDRYVASPKALKEKTVWEKLQKLHEEGTSTKVTIAKIVKGGVEVFIEGVRAFLPGRYIRLPGISQENWVNQEIEVIVEELDYKEKNIILNQRKAFEIEKQKRAEVTIQKLKEGDIVDAAVLRIADFGIFVDLGGLDGLVPASELSWGRFNHPKEICKVGQTMKARIFRIEKENKRVALSVKQVLGDPWDQLDTDFEVGKQLTGKVVSEAAFGVFIELRPGVEALLHNSEMQEGIEKPKLNAVITVKIIKIDSEQRKIGLSTRDLEVSSSIPEASSEYSHGDSVLEKQDTMQESSSENTVSDTETLSDNNLTTTYELNGKEA